MIQICIAKITGYGPWTLTLGSDREHVLQMLQATLYKNLQERFSEKNCLVFSNRADEFFAIQLDCPRQNALWFSEQYRFHHLTVRFFLPRMRQYLPRMEYLHILWKKRVLCVDHTSVLYHFMLLNIKSICYGKKFICPVNTRQFFSEKRSCRFLYKVACSICSTCSLSLP